MSDVFKGISGFLLMLLIDTSPSHLNPEMGGGSV